MPIFEIGNDSFTEIEEITFASAGLKERGDIQRLLRKQIDVISPDTLIIAEEFSDWEDSKRRIDLLGIDKQANIVVIELKTTESGGHMELQAIRYAAMVSAMTYEKAVDAYGNYLKKIGSDADAKESILDFLGQEEVDEDSFAQDVRILLVSADFSKEITTAVMWLNERSLDIRCVRMKPYRYSDKIVVDVEQVIPLPEADEIMVKIREKVQKERHDRAEKSDRRHLRGEFWQELLAMAKGRLSLYDNVSVTDRAYIVARSGKGGVHYSFNIRKDGAAVNFVIDGIKAKNKMAFDLLFKQKLEIDNNFNGSLDWCVLMT